MKFKLSLFFALSSILTTNCYAESGSVALPLPTATITNNSGSTFDSLLLTTEQCSNPTASNTTQQPDQKKIPAGDSNQGVSPQPVTAP